MKFVEEKILAEGVVINDDILKVDSFLNHQIDPVFLKRFAQEVKNRFGDLKIDKILTLETSGIAVAYQVAEVLGDLPLIFGKKSKSATVVGEFYEAEVKSFTRGIVSTIRVSKSYLKEGERILLVDDFLAEGNGAMGMVSLCEQAKAIPVGFAAVIEKIFQGGRDKLMKAGIPVLIGASITRFEHGKPLFATDLS